MSDRTELERRLLRVASADDVQGATRKALRDAVEIIGDMRDALEEADAGLCFAGADKDIPDKAFVPAPTLSLRSVRAALEKLRAAR